MARKPKRNARGEVWCGMCSRYRTSDHFGTTRTGSHIYFKSYCRDCCRTYDREYGQHRYKSDASFRTAMIETTRVRQKRVSQERLESQVQMISYCKRVIQQLQGNGLTIKAIAHHAGLSESTVGDLHRRERKHVKRHTSDRLTELAQRMQVDRSAA